MINQIVIPARNEEMFLPLILKELWQMFENAPHVIVVDNASDDCTATAALTAGVTALVHEERIGKGYAVRKGLESADPGLVLICDADIEGLTAEMIQQLQAVHTESGASVSRLAIGRPPELAPVTSLIARPLLSLLGFSQSALEEPIGGVILVDRDFVLSQHLLGGWGFDLSLTLSVLGLGVPLPEVRITGVSHRYKPMSDYVAMAHDVLRAGLIAGGALSWDHYDCVRCR